MKKYAHNNFSLRIKKSYDKLNNFSKLNYII